ncbi:MAG: NAD-dependent epimerase/dehydratase family protein [Verrucomicrobiota bacterium]
MKSVLVTGATGFVGRHLCHYLADRRQVRAVYRSEQPPAGYPDAVTWVKLDTIGPDTDWTEALDGVDDVVHLAALAHLAQTNKDAPEQDYYQVNAEGSAGLARAMKARAQSGRLVFISSIGVIGSFADSAVSEETPCQPDTPYGKSKLQAEEALMEILAEGETDWVALRPPLIYGPGNPGNMARLASLTRIPLPLPVGGFRNQRSFLGVENLVSAIALSLEHPGVSRRVFCLADDERVSTPDLIRLIGEVKHRRVLLMTVPMPLLRSLAILGDKCRAIIGRSPGWDSYVLDRLAGSLAVDASRFVKTTGWRQAKTLRYGLREAFAATDE